VIFLNIAKGNALGFGATLILDDQVFSCAQTPKDCYKKGFLSNDKRRHWFSSMQSDGKIFEHCFDNQGITPFGVCIFN
jgi:hypothetical protein